MNKKTHSANTAKKKILNAIDVLEQLFGIPKWNVKDPLDELMVTILSQNTNDKNRDLAYGRLRERFKSWSDVMKAGVEDIEEAIRPAGLSKQKSKRMKDVLEWIFKTRRELDLDFLHDLKDEEAIELLTSQKGVGVKTAAVTLAFSLDRDICPVDTHVHRISRRLGWVKESATADQAFYQLKELIPNGKAQTFHLNILKFGRTICLARNPKCLGCPLWNDCIWEGKKYPRSSNPRQTKQGTNH